MTKKRKITLIVVAVILIAVMIFVATRLLVGRTTGIDNKPEAEVNGNSNILVAYFSWSGHGQQMARWISDETDADLFRIVPSESYGEDYNECADRAKMSWITVSDLSWLSI